MRQIALILSLLSFNAQADRVAPIFEFGEGYWCKNYSGQLHIVGKIASKQYEVYFPDPMTGRDQGHMVLETHKSDFTSDGVVPEDLWVKGKPGDFPNVTVKQNGLDKKYELIEESAECEAKAAHMASHPSAEQVAADKKADEDQTRDMAEHAAWAESYRQSKANKRAFSNLSKAEQKKIRDQKVKDSEAKSLKWSNMSAEEQEARCKAQGKIMDVQSYCMD